MMAPLVVNSMIDQRSMSWRIAYCLIGVTCTAFFFFVLFQSDSGYAQSETSIKSGDVDNSTLSVSGTATTKVKPDKVILSLGVESTNETAADALAENSVSMNNIISALKSQGVKENETSTSVFSVYPNYNYTESGAIVNISGFTVVNSIQIESGRIDNVSRWIDTSIESGANNINNLAFTISEKKRDETRSMLITGAISNARQEAEVASASVGLEITGVQSILIKDFDEVQPPQPYFASEALAQPSAENFTPILSGEQDLKANVDIIYIIR